MYTHVAGEEEPSAGAPGDYKSKYQGNKTWQEWKLRNSKKCGKILVSVVTQKPRKEMVQGGGRNLLFKYLGGQIICSQNWPCSL